MGRRWQRAFCGRVDRHDHKADMQRYVCICKRIILLCPSTKPITWFFAYHRFSVYFVWKISGWPIVTPYLFTAAFSGFCRSTVICVNTRSPICAIYHFFHGCHICFSALRFLPLVWIYEKFLFSRIQCSVHFSFPLLSRVIHTKALFLYIFANICLSIKNHPCYEISYWYKKKYSCVLPKVSDDS